MGDRRSVEQEPIPAAVVSESLAKRLWPAERYATPWAARSVKATTGPPVTVIGIVQDVRPAALDRELLQIYRPHPQRPSANMTLVVRTSQESGALAKVGANIDSLLQRPGHDKNALPFVVTTEPCLNSTMDKAVRIMGKMDCMLEKPLCLQMLEPEER